MERDWMRGTWHGEEENQRVKDGGGIIRRGCEIFNQTKETAKPLPDQ